MIYDKFIRWYHDCKQLVAFWIGGFAQGLEEVLFVGALAVVNEQEVNVCGLRLVLRRRRPKLRCIELGQARQACWSEDLLSHLFSNNYSFSLARRYLFAPADTLLG